MATGDESLPERLDRIDAVAETMLQSDTDTRDATLQIKSLVHEIKSTLPTESDFREMVTEVVGPTLSQEEVARLASALVDLMLGRR